MRREKVLQKSKEETRKEWPVVSNPARGQERQARENVQGSDNTEVVTSLDKRVTCLR